MNVAAMKFDMRISIHAPRLLLKGGDFIFQSTLPAWGATKRRCNRCNNFNPRSPRGERRGGRWAKTARSTYFNPRSPRGERHCPVSSGLNLSDFNPRSPRGERQSITRHIIIIYAFQSTLPAWGATLVAGLHNGPLRISIHAPRVGSDAGPRGQGQREPDHFNPRSPRGERRRSLFLAPSSLVFQSTLPAWGATSTMAVIKWPSQYFNPRSPRGERPRAHRHAIRRYNFNPRSPRGERREPGYYDVDVSVFQSTLPAWGATADVGALAAGSTAFQSTLPAWGATLGLGQSRQRCAISIHAPRVGSDLRGASVAKPARCISIHAPRVGSDAMAAAREFIADGFQSTLPAWGATYEVYKLLREAFNFNPRSPRGERPDHRRNTARAKSFQSTLPAWGATPHILNLLNKSKISIHAPRVGSDWLSKREELEAMPFQSTLPAWGATETSQFSAWALMISIHAPRVGSDPA